MTRALIYQIYALLVCLVCLVWLLMTVSQLWNTAVHTQLMSPERQRLECDGMVATPHMRDIEAPRESDEAIAERSRMQSEFCMRDMQRRQFQFRDDLLRHGPLLVILLVLFIFHWKLARRAKD